MKKNMKENLTRKENLVAIIEAIPADLLNAAYCLDLLLQTKVQLEYNPELAKKYRDVLKVSDQGYLCGELPLDGGYTLSIVLTN